MNRPLRDPIHFFDERGRSIVSQEYLEAELAKARARIEHLERLLRRAKARLEKTEADQDESGTFEG